MTGPLSCPIDGCDGQAVDANGLANHIMHSNLADHPDNWDECMKLAREAIDGSGDSGTEGNQGTDRDGDPTVDDGPPDPTEAEPTCPECGESMYFDASEHTDFRYGCKPCSTDDEWVVWDE